MHPKDIKLAFERGENITQLLRKKHKSNINTEEIIETAYDLQSGSYIDALQDKTFKNYKAEYGAAIAVIFQSLCEEGGSVLEAGVGEGTTLSFVMNSGNNFFNEFHGFDLSWSRVAKCQKWLKSESLNANLLSVASILHIPYVDNAFDIVYTSHTIEPNGGKEKPILEELYRVAGRYLVLFEPGYELASKESKKRMDKLGYAKGIKETALTLGMNVIRHELFHLSSNSLNPTAITVIEKKPQNAILKPQLACPLYGDPLLDKGDALYSPISMRAYPKLLNIPCLRVSNAIIASQYETY